MITHEIYVNMSELYQQSNSSNPKIRLLTDVHGESIFNPTPLKIKERPWLLAISKGTEISFSVMGLYNPLQKFWIMLIKNYALGIKDHEFRKGQIATLNIDDEPVRVDFTRLRVTEIEALMALSSKK